MMTLSKQRKFTFNSLLEDIRGSKCCVIKVRQYILIIPILHTRIRVNNFNVNHSAPTQESRHQKVSRTRKKHTHTVGMQINQGIL